MSTIKSSDEHLTLNADGSSKDIKFQANGVEKASISSAGVMTATTFAGSGASLTALPAAQVTGTMSGVNFKDVGLTTNAIGSIGGGTQDIDLTLGNSVTGTVDTSTTTFTFSNPTASDELCVFTLVLTNGGSQTVNFPAAAPPEAP